MSSAADRALLVYLQVPDDKVPVCIAMRYAFEDRAVSAEIEGKMMVLCSRCPAPRGRAFQALDTRWKKSRSDMYKYIYIFRSTGQPVASTGCKQSEYLLSDKLRIQSIWNPQKSH